MENFGKLAKSLANIATYSHGNVRLNAEGTKFEAYGTNVLFGRIVRRHRDTGPEENQRARKAFLNYIGRNYSPQFATKVSKIIDTTGDDSTKPLKVSTVKRILKDADTDMGREAYLKATGKTSQEKASVEAERSVDLENLKTDSEQMRSQDESIELDEHHDRWMAESFSR